jgi:hypothetical protein
MNTNPEWKLVPVVPTEEMLDAARRAPLPLVMLDSQIARENLEIGARYRAMLGTAPEAPPLTVTVDPDPRGVSVGVYQGSSCVYNGAHPIPTGATGEDERQAFEAWADDNGFALDCDFFEVSGQYYDHDDTQLAYDIWRAARAAIVAPAAGDALDSDRLDFLATHGAWIAWSRDRECCRVFHVDADGQDVPICGWGDGNNWLTARDAIDAAIAQQSQRKEA